MDKLILDEERFPYENMSLDEKNAYLNIVRHCKDISDSIYKVNGTGECQIVEMHLKKVNTRIEINGAVTIGNEENRCIAGSIFPLKDYVIVDMNITRLSKEGAIMEYVVLDKFALQNGRLIRNSFYDHDKKIITDEIQDDAMKGMIK